MSLKKIHDIQRTAVAQHTAKPARAENEYQQISPAGSLERVVAKAPAPLTPADVLTLQRTVGNRAVQRIFGNRPQARRPQSLTPANAVQRKTEEEEPLQAKLETTGREKKNRSGLPGQLKAGIERLSGMKMDDVRVHYNSSKPARVQARAFTRGTDIHLGPDEEEHLPHEAWHVVQQKQGRVQPTLQARGVAINDDDGLEREADAKGARALLLGQLRENAVAGAPDALVSPASRPHTAPVIQRVGTLTVTDIDFNPETRRHRNQALLMDKYGPALIQFVGANLDAIAPPGTSRRDQNIQGPLRTRITNDAANYATWADLAAADVDSLVTRIVNHLLRNPGAGQLDAEALRPGVENAVRHGLPSAGSDSDRAQRERTDLTETEIGAVNALLDVATTRSSAKGVPNVVSVASLNDAVNGLGDAVRAVRDPIVTRNETLLRRMGREIDLINQDNLGNAAGLGLGIRSMHQNGAGWLPPGAVNNLLDFQALLNQIDQAKTNLLTIRRLNQIGRLEPNARVQARLGIERQAVGQVMNAQNARERIKLIWSSYALNQGGLMNYVEFNVGARINRIMYDYVNGRFYITAHYNWYRGYNPFFQVTGLRDT